jgi:hypothetical protein
VGGDRFLLCADGRGLRELPGSRERFLGAGVVFIHRIVGEEHWLQKARRICGLEPKADGARLPKAVHALVNVPFSRDLGFSKIGVDFYSGMKIGVET